MWEMDNVAPPRAHLSGDFDEFSPSSELFRDRIARGQDDGPARRKK